MINRPTQGTALLDSLSERLLARLERHPWRDMPVEDIQDSLVFRSQHLTLLCAEQPARASAWPDDVTPFALAQRHGGVLDECSAASVLASFTQPVAALEMAMDLQRQSRTRYGIALVTGTCMTAQFLLDGRSWRVLVGREVVRAEGLARRVAAGSVMVSPDTFPLLEAHFADGLCDGILAAEFVDEVVTEATITLAPGASAESSTFAGLGLTC